MKQTLWLALLLCSTLTAYPRQNYSFRVENVPYRFGKEFHIESSDFQPGSIWKRGVLSKARHLDPRTAYELYDYEGELDAYGICRIFCMGAFYDWGTEIDVYDREDRKVGYIDGKAVTTEAACFDIWNSDNVKVGVAYINSAYTGITVYHPEKSKQVICCMEREVVQDAPDSWDVMVNDKRQIDTRLLQVFAAWAVDRQENFKRDT